MNQIIIQHIFTGLDEAPFAPTIGSIVIFLVKFYI